MSNVLFMQNSHVLLVDCGQSCSNSGQRSSLLDGNTNDVGEQKNY